jgi:adenylylsulfate reductase subunit B
MPTYVRTDKCDGCEGQDKAACMTICPHDLMLLDKDGSQTGHVMKAYNQEPEQCWECYACVKICPQQAIECRHYADIVPMGAQVQPQRSTDSIMWSIKFRNGSIKQFKFPIRTTAEGSADPLAGHGPPDLADLEQPDVLFTQDVHACDMSQFLKS